ncbi:hypothetical protein [Clostridium botulinum]|uniref:hypothetical protein n=1 Tax=Clostridium botulinum TaxID=1491 RepID=UPI0004D79C44|nr:hypothetical protein [Clostridium botulinum]KEH96443.1 CRISPR-associated protein Cas7 [Clostridium botulinum D str. 16868]MCD3276688.1 hypothetical protein [Clostridium botulinum C/D]MCD3288287.1 hypothetical protein [Clostridium botulinum C/D]MCD3290796.1 hypothetical protein [Clostridium botulinum C/D]MCD3303780.1 hypothetical protein [Clostridium botulinum C/D]
MKDNRFLNIIYAIEGLNSRLNGSSKEVEGYAGGNDNITFTKKIGGKAYVSAPCVKKNMKEFMGNQGYEISTYKKNGSQVVSASHPARFLNEDVFGLMLASKEEITEEEYNELDDEMKKLYKGNKKKYTRNVTKKRRANFMMNGIIGVNRRRVNKEFGICKAENESMPYKLETYSDMLVGLGSLNINETGKFNISDEATEFRDYSIKEAEILGIKEELSKEHKFNRIKTALQGLQYLSLKSNQSNYLTDTMPKVVILGEYKWGNNVFQGLINKDGVNIEGLKEVLEEYNHWRNSKIWIGVSNRILNEEFETVKEDLEKEFGNYDDIVIGSVKNAFDGYLEYLKETMK